MFRFEIYHRYGEWKCRFPWDLFHRHQVDMIKIWEWAVRRYRVVGLIPTWCCGWLGAPDTPSFWPMARRTGQLYCWDLTSGQSTTTPRYCPGPSWCYRTTDLVLPRPAVSAPPTRPSSVWAPAPVPSSPVPAVTVQTWASVVTGGLTARRLNYLQIESQHLYLFP